MIRFIYICMAVVALSAIATGVQYLGGGLGDAQQDIAARNDAAPQDANNDVAAVPAPVQDTDTATAEALNQIDTAAGANDAGNEDFGTDAANEAPKALRDDADTNEVPAIAAEPGFEDIAH